MPLKVPENLSLSTSSSSDATGTATGGTGDFGLTLGGPVQPRDWTALALPAVALIGIGFLIWRGR